MFWKKVTQLYLYNKHDYIDIMNKKLRVDNDFLTEASKTKKDTHHH